MPQEPFSQRVATEVSPAGRLTASITESIMVTAAMRTFAISKTMWTLPLLWTPRTRPQKFGDLAKRATFPQRPQRSCLLCRQKKKNEDQTVHIDCPPNRITSRAPPGDAREEHERRRQRRRRHCDGILMAA